METRFARFVRERQFLHNVSARTLEWYENSLRWLPCESPTQEQLNGLVIGMRERRTATGCNCTIRAINAYLHWNTGSERRCGAGCNHPRIQRLKEPRLVLPTFTDVQVKRLVAWKPRGKYQRRLHLLVLLLLDTGARISEALALHVADVNFDDLLVTLDGKGAKQRVVPFSRELRKALFRYVAGFKADSLVFATGGANRVARNNALRDVKQLCKKLGFIPPIRTLHAFRHTFAVNYLRRGGSVFHLQKCLGHSSLEMTRKYANLTTVDLQAVTSV